MSKCQEEYATHTLIIVTTIYAKSYGHLCHLFDSCFHDNAKANNIKLICIISQLQRLFLRRFLCSVKREKFEKKQFHLIGRLPSWDDGILSYHHLFNVKNPNFNFVQ